MTNEYFNIKDTCRKGLLKYLGKAVSAIPEMKNPSILDIGCGTGVPTLALAEMFNGDITAVDSDARSIRWLEEKVRELNLSHRITCLNVPFSGLAIEDSRFDIIIAEGFLNAVGFRKGFLKLLKLLRENGYFIIHDDLTHFKEKTSFITANNCVVPDSFRLNEQVWWDDYYKCLEKEIARVEDKKLAELFTPDMQEIKEYKKNPSRFTSAYFVIKKTG